MSHELYWIWLQDVLGYQNKLTNSIISEDISPLDIYNARANLGNYPFFEELSKQEKEKIKNTNTDHAQKVLEHCQKKRYNIVTPDSEVYFDRLRNIYIPPLVLYVEGNFINLDTVPTISIVGTRNMTAYGKKVAEYFASQLSMIGFMIVSGFALGVDTEAHKGALKSDGGSIAILAGGLDKNYPIENWELRDKILKKGAVISEYQPDVQPYRVNFPIRNRLIAGFSLGVIVVEGRRTSGAMITVEHALQQGKDIFAVPSRIHEPYGEAPLSLIKEGAKLIVGVEDVLEEYLRYFKKDILIQYNANGIAIHQGNSLIDSFEVNESILDQKANTAGSGSAFKIKSEFDLNQYNKNAVLPVGSEIVFPDELGEDHKLVFELLSKKPKIFYDLLRESNLKTNQLLSILTGLEIHGLIKAYPGKWFGL